MLVELVFVNLGDFSEHFVDFTSLLADADHLREEWHDVIFVFERFGERFTAFDFFGGGVDAGGDDGVVDGFRRDGKCVEHGDTSTEENLRSAGETGHIEAAEKRAEERGGKFEGVGGFDAGFGFEILANTPDSDSADDNHKPPEAHDELLGADHEARQCWERLVHVVVELFDLRDDGEEHEDNHDDDHDEDDSGVSHGAADFTHHGGVFFLLGSDTAKGFVEGTAGLTCCDEGKVDFVKNFWVLCE